MQCKEFINLSGDQFCLFSNSTYFFRYKIKNPPICTVLTRHVKVCRTVVKHVSNNALATRPPSSLGQKALLAALGEQSVCHFGPRGLHEHSLMVSGH